MFLRRSGLSVFSALCAVTRKYSFGVRLCCCNGVRVFFASSRF